MLFSRASLASFLSSIALLAAGCSANVSSDGPLLVELPREDWGDATYVAADGSELPLATLGEDVAVFIDESAYEHTDEELAIDLPEGQALKCPAIGMLEQWDTLSVPHDVQICRWSSRGGASNCTTTIVRITESVQCRRECGGTCSPYCRARGALPSHLAHQIGFVPREEPTFHEEWECGWIEPEPQDHLP